MSRTTVLGVAAGVIVFGGGLGVLLIVLVAARPSEGRVAPSSEARLPSEKKPEVRQERRHEESNVIGPTKDANGRRYEYRVADVWDIYEHDIVRFEREFKGKWLDNWLENNVMGKDSNGYYVFNWDNNVQRKMKVYLRAEDAKQLSEWRKTWQEPHTDAEKRRTNEEMSHHRLRVFVNADPDLSFTDGHLVKAER